MQRDTGQTGTAGAVAAGRVPAAAGARRWQEVWERHHLAFAVAGCALFLAAARLAQAVNTPAGLQWVLYFAAYVSGGFFSLRAGLATLFGERRIDVDLLMVVAAVAAAAIGEPLEGGVLLFLFSLSNALQHYALERTRRAITALMAYRPQVALRKEPDGTERTVPVEALQPGDVIVVRPGELVPIDGIIRAGSSALNEATITGESVPVDKSAGDKVFAGTLNHDGALEVEVTARAEETVLARIIRRVEEAEAERSPTQRAIEKVEQYYATGVIAATVLAAVIPGLLGYGWSAAVYRALTLMVVASPCAVAMAVPSAVVAALANGARSGVLFKGGAPIERMADVAAVAFDKTGTLTEGMPAVVDVIPLAEAAPQEVLALAAAVESRSEHPLAQAVLRAAEEAGCAVAAAEAAKALPGRGVVGEVSGRRVWVGNRHLLQAEAGHAAEAALARAAELEASGLTVMFVGDGDAVLGLIAVQDRLRPGAAAAVRRLKDAGVRRVVMLTGDNGRVARLIGEQAGVDTVYYELLPEEKADLVAKLRDEAGPVAMVGDGVNDAPALAYATVGVAMGRAGTDVAMETADVVLMSDDLSKLAHALTLSRRTRRIIRQNLALALGVIAVMVVLVWARGIALAAGVVAHEGSTVLVILNSMRLLFGQHRSPQQTARSL